jgi:hypothetical protein
MQQDKIDSLTRLVSSRTGSDKEIRELQGILRDEKLYTGKADGDVGAKTAGGLMQLFRDNPAMLNNVAPWLLKSMEEQGYGKQLRDLVAANPNLRAQLVESALDLVDHHKNQHTEQQVKLSLLGLYNYKDGIDGVKGKEHVQAIKDLRELSVSLKASSQQQFDALTKEVDKAGKAFIENTHVDAMPVAPPPPPPKTQTTKTETVAPPAQASSAPKASEPVSEVTVTAKRIKPDEKAGVPVSPNGQENSFAALSGVPVTPEIIADRLAGIIDITPRLHDSFNRAVRSNATGAPVMTPNASLAGPTVEEQKRIMAQFLTTSSVSRGLAFFDVLAQETKGDGDYDMVNGGKRVGLREKTLDGVIEWQKERMKEQGEAMDRAEKKARKQGITDEDQIKVIREEAKIKVGTTGAGINQVVYKTLKGVKEELGLSGKEPFDETLQHTVTAALLVRRGYPRWLLSEGKPRDESRIMASLAGEWAAFPKNKSGEGVHDGVGNNSAYVAPTDMLTALRKDREAFQQYLKDPAMVADDQRKAFDHLMEVSDTLARPKGKGRDNRADAGDGDFTVAAADISTRVVPDAVTSPGGLVPSLDPGLKRPVA